MRQIHVVVDTPMNATDFQQQTHGQVAGFPTTTPRLSVQPFLSIAGLAVVVVVVVVVALVVVVVVAVVVALAVSLRCCQTMPSSTRLVCLS